MKSACELIVNPALSHTIQRGGHHVERLLVTTVTAVIDEQIENRGMREFGRRAESAVLRVEALDSGLHHRFHYACRNLA